MVTKAVIEPVINCKHKTCEFGVDASSMAPSYTIVLLKTPGASDDEAPCPSDDDAFWLSHKPQQT